MISFDFSGLDDVPTLAELAPFLLLANEVELREVARVFADELGLHDLSLEDVDRAFEQLGSAWREQVGDRHSPERVSWAERIFTRLGRVFPRLEVERVAQRATGRLRRR